MSVTNIIAWDTGNFTDIFNLIFFYFVHVLLIIYTIKTKRYTVPMTIITISYSFILMLGQLGIYTETNNFIVITWFMLILMLIINMFKKVYP